jgi:hypothetical protein
MFRQYEDWWNPLGEGTVHYAGSGGYFSLPFSKCPVRGDRMFRVELARNCPPVIECPGSEKQIAGRVAIALKAILFNCGF